MIHVYLVVAKHVLRYLKGTIEYGIKYAMDQRIILHGYVYSDWAGLNSVCCFSLGSGMIA